MSMVLEASAVLSLRAAFPLGALARSIYNLLLVAKSVNPSDAGPNLRESLDNRAGLRTQQTADLLSLTQDWTGDCPSTLRATAQDSIDVSGIRHQTTHL